VLPTTALMSGETPSASGLMSATKVVPFAVPSVFHSSIPDAPSSPAK
jgi:hypothetical protein